MQFSIRLRSASALRSAFSVSGDMITQAVLLFSRNTSRIRFSKYPSSSLERISPIAFSYARPITGSPPKFRVDIIFIKMQIPLGSPQNCCSRRRNSALLIRPFMRSRSIPFSDRFSKTSRHTELISDSLPSSALRIHTVVYGCCMPSTVFTSTSVPSPFSIIAFMRGAS